MASESNSTLHSAMRLHIDNLKLLSLPLDQLQKEIPSLSDLDEESEASIAEVGTPLHQHHHDVLGSIKLASSSSRCVEYLAKWTR